MRIALLYLYSPTLSTEDNLREVEKTAGALPEKSLRRSY
jgi:hypothetical protein